MIFLTSHKIDCPIDVGRCHFILDKTKSWENFYTKHPLAFCIGCKEEEIEDVCKKFRKINFKIIKGPSYKKYTAIIARNEKFIDQFEKNINFSISV